MVECVTETEFSGKKAAEMSLLLLRIMVEMADCELDRYY